MNTHQNEEIKRFCAFSVANVPSTFIDLGLVWLLSSVVFSSYVGCYVVAPIVAFVVAALINYYVYDLFVWNDRNLAHNKRSTLVRMGRYFASVTSSFLARIAVIQVLGVFLRLSAVVCDLASMLVSGMMNFFMNEKWVFGAHSTQATLSRRARFLRHVAHPFLRVKVQGEHHIQPSDQARIFVCNHGFWYGPVAAAGSLPVPFRPWIHDKVLHRSTFIDEVSVCFEAKWRHLRCSKAIVAHLLFWPTQWVLRAFRPIAVTRGHSTKGSDTIAQSVIALNRGENLLIFPELPRNHNAVSLKQERADSRNLRGFYTGFAQLGSALFEATGKVVGFYPVYANQHNKTLTIGEPIYYQPAQEPHAEKVRIANLLYQEIGQLGNFTNLM